MTPKDKATELIEKFRATEISYFEAKQCAIIAVKEVLFTVTSLMYLTAYYQEVLTELE